jgi:cytochrome c peroxidase
MSMGVRSTAEIAVRAGIQHIQFAQRPEKDAKAIDAFLKSIQAVPSPFLKKGKLSQAAVRGKAIYDKAKCNACHSGEYYTDLKMYDVGTGLDNSPEQTFDTPTLIEAWRTAPYLHDGRAATLEEVFTQYNPEDKHGVTSNLTMQEMDDLIEYISSL